MADAAPIAVEIHDVVEERYPAAVEAAAYLVVAEAIDDAAGRGATFATVDTMLDGTRMLVTIEDDGSGARSPMLALADRVGAVGGDLILEPGSTRAELPCA